MPTRLTMIVVDANDLRALSTWWSELLGWPIVESNDDEVALEAPEAIPLPPGTIPALTFALVEEPKVGKDRIHLDLASDSAEDQARQVARALALGATHADIGQEAVPWVVLADPEGNEFCVLDPRDRYRGEGPLAAIVLDARDPHALAEFWSAASGWPVALDTEDIVSLHNPNGRLPDIDIVPDENPKLGKNRVHLDIAPEPGEDQAIAVARLEALGAQRIDIGQGEQTWVVMADPEGNEFCVLSAR